MFIRWKRRFLTRPTGLAADAVLVESARVHGKPRLTVRCHLGTLKRTYAVPVTDLSDAQRHALEMACRAEDQHGPGAWVSLSHRVRLHALRILWDQDNATDFLTRALRRLAACGLPPAETERLATTLTAYTRAFVGRADAGAIHGPERPRRPLEEIVAAFPLRNGNRQPEED